MESDQWHQARLAFDEWLSVQQIYDAEQVAQLPNRFRQRIAEMSARELQVFLDQMQSKLAILLSPQAADARNWLGRYVSARVVFSENELKQFDIVNMTPAQLDAVMRTVETRRASRRRAAEAHNRSRQDQVERHLGLQRQQEQSRLQARSAASAASRNSRSSFQSQYAPRRPEPAPAPRPALFVDPFGGISRTLP